VCAAGETRLTDAAFANVYSRVEGDLLGASVSGETVAREQLLAMLSVRQTVDAQVKDMLAAFNSEKALKTEKGAAPTVAAMVAATAAATVATAPATSPAAAAARVSNASPSSGLLGWSDDDRKAALAGKGDKEETLSKAAATTKAGKEDAVKQKSAEGSNKEEEDEEMRAKAEHQGAHQERKDLEESASGRGSAAPETRSVSSAMSSSVDLSELLPARKDIEEAASGVGSEAPVARSASSAMSSSVDLSELLRENIKGGSKPASRASSFASKTASMKGAAQHLEDDDDLDEIVLPSPKIELAAGSAGQRQPQTRKEEKDDDGSEPPSLPSSMQSTPKSDKNFGGINQILHPSQALALGGQTVKDLRGLDKILSSKKASLDDEESDWDQDMSSASAGHDLSHDSPLPSGRAGKFKLEGGGSKGAPRERPPALVVPSDPVVPRASSKAASAAANDTPRSDSWDTPTPTPAKSVGLGDGASEGSDWDAAESPALPSLGRSITKKTTAGVASARSVAASDVLSDWDESPAPNKGKSKQIEENDKEDGLDKSDAQSVDWDEEEDLDGIAALLGGGLRSKEEIAKENEKAKELEAKKKGYGGGITAELVSSVKQSLRKTGINVTTPAGGVAQSQGAGMKWALSGAAASSRGDDIDDSLEVDYL
jgi:hypothetical protein